MAGLKTYSPLRYPGGKKKLTKYIIELLKSNNIENGIYVEPYAGGAAVALKLLIDGHVNEIIINDFDRSIYALWHSILNNTDELCAMIENTDININSWYEQKEIQKNKNDAPLLQLGFSTLFLNRTNRSGIIKAGVIGGINQNGNYKIDCRFKKDELIGKIRLISQFRDRITLYNYDTVFLINNILININENSLIFFDPPYYNKGSQLYVNYYKHKDHIELRDSIVQLNNKKWIITYDNTPEINEMYIDFTSTTYGLTYTAGKICTGVETMIYNNNIIIPETSIV